MSEKALSLGQRVKVIGKDVKGSVAYVGHPTFATGKWIGVILDEAKGKNNGTVRGHAYFTCEENYGVFVRQTQIQLLDGEDNPMETSMTASTEEPKTSSRRLSSITVAQKSRPTTSRTSLASSRQSLTSYASPTAERAGEGDSNTGKRAAFVETNDNATSEIVNDFTETCNLRNELNTLLDHSKDVKIDDVSKSSVDVDDEDEDDDYHSTDDSEEAIDDDDDEVDGDGASDSNNDSLMYDQNVSDETNFVETLTPQYTAGASITGPAPHEDRIALLQTQQENVTLKAEVEDLKEKLETIKVKRAEDRDKLKELERVRLQLEQANEFKAKIMESQAQLQRDLQRAKKEVRDAQEALEAHNDETADLQEAAEMAALDKEMAEERAEALQMELEQCREKLEEATLDLQLMKAEMEAGGNIQHPYASSDAGATGYELRQLQQQNCRLRDTLVRLRDLSAHDKHAMQKMQKDLEQCRSEVAELSRTKEKLSSRVEELEAQVADLQEQVDAALGAEEMVEQLADKKMALEDQVEQLKQDVTELEALQEIHEQLVESSRELEVDLREELELAHAGTREV
ncbi:hypothetical protein JYU34_018220 [Plutella xylostella]|uniref:CAP-Gly domain-containing protein n=1 Tax=Plutella xylostella TaxID=51655 RepID=A0ABQ7Q0V1_PLUXY|nr:hypothetical protein JYU34_018220 [Plutella xylostella]